MCLKVLVTLFCNLLHTLVYQYIIACIIVLEYLTDGLTFSGMLTSYSLTIYGTAIDAYSQNYTAAAHNYTCHSDCDPYSGCFGSASSQCVACRSGLLLTEDTQ